MVPEEASNLRFIYLFNISYLQCGFVKYQQLYQQIEFPMANRLAFWLSA